MNTEIKRVNDLTGEDEYYTESNNTTKKSLLSKIKDTIKLIHYKLIYRDWLVIIILSMFAIAIVYFWLFPLHLPTKILTSTQITEKVNKYKTELTLKNQIAIDKKQIKADKNKLNNLEYNFLTAKPQLINKVKGN